MGAIQIRPAGVADHVIGLMRLIVETRYLPVTSGTDHVPVRMRGGIGREIPLSHWLLHEVQQIGVELLPVRELDHVRRVVVDDELAVRNQIS
jgi:hypothetical protein